MEELLGINDVSRILKIRESTLRAWVFQRRIPVVRIGRLVRFKRSELERWIRNEHRQEAK